MREWGDLTPGDTRACRLSAPLPAPGDGQPPSDQVGVTDPRVPSPHQRRVSAEAGCKGPRGREPWGLTPARGAAHPALQFRGAARPSPLRAVPGRGRPARGSAPTPGGRAGPARGLGHAGAARAGRLAAAAARAGGGPGRAGPPRVPGGRANGCLAFGKIAIYGHVLGPRAPPFARAPRSRLNSGGGGRARSQSPPPARALRSFCRSAARPPQVSRPLPRALGLPYLAGEPHSPPRRPGRADLGNKGLGPDGRRAVGDQGGAGAGFPRPRGTGGLGGGRRRL